MSQPINLNKVRKEKARKDKRAEADRNAVVHGLTRAQKDAAAKEAARRKALLDGKKSDET